MDYNWINIGPVLAQIYSTQKATVTSTATHRGHTGTFCPDFEGVQSQAQLDSEPLGLKVPGCRFSCTFLTQSETQAESHSKAPNSETQTSAVTLWKRLRDTQGTALAKTPRAPPAPPPGGPLQLQSEHV